MTLTRADVSRAAEEIAGLVRTTPVFRFSELDELVGAELYLKAENLQRIGAFKARGAMLSVGRLTDDERARGVITYSSGNHAQAVALAARHFGAAAEIAMPIDAPKVKVEVVRALGARITFAGRTSLDRRQAALKIQARTGGVIIEPFDHPHTIAGQGTATLELLEQCGTSLDAIVVPVGGGGLIAGACLAAEGTSAAIHAVEPVGCDSMRRSLEAGEVVPVDPGPTIADGLKPTRIGELNFAVARDRIASAITVDDEQIGRALALLLMRCKLLVEPSGAAALAACLARKVPGKKIGVILSGGNVAPDRVRELLANHIG